MYRWPLAVVLIFGFAFAAAPTAEELAIEYRQARTQAEQSGVERIMPALSLERADQIAKRAESLLKTRPADAARLYRDALWHLPKLPANAPDHLVRMLGNPTLHHGGMVDGLAFDRVNHRLASASADHTVRVWNLRDGRLEYEYRGHNDRVRAVIALASGEFISAAGKEIHIWSPKDNKPSKVLAGSTGYIICLALRLDGKFLVSSGEDRIVRVWNLEEGKEAYSLGGQNAMVKSVAFSPDGNRIAAGNGQGWVTVWETASKERRKVLEQQPFSGEANTVRFSPDGKTLAICGEKAAKLMVLPAAPGETAEPAGAIRRSFDGPNGHGDLVTAVDFSPDGKTLATGGRDNSVRLWDVASGQVLRTFLGHSEEVAVVAFSADGSWLASAGQDQSIRLWNLDPVVPVGAFAGHRGPVWSAVFSPNGQHAATAGADRAIRLWDIATGRELRVFNGHGQPVTAIAFTADGRNLVSASGDRTIRVWPIAGGEPRVIEGSGGPVLALSLRENLVVTGDGEHMVRGWDLQTGKSAFAWSGHKAVVTAVAIRPDGEQIASCGADGMVKIWHGASGKGTSSFRAHDAGGAAALVYSTDGRRLITCGGDRLIKVWNVVGGMSPVFTLPGHSGPVTSLSLSTDGKFLASAGADTFVKVWDLTARSEVQTFRGHGDWVASVAFSRDASTLISAAVDGKTLLWRLNADAGDTAGSGHVRSVTALLAVSGGGLMSGGKDRQLILWDAATGRERRKFPGHLADVIALAASTDGAQILSSGQDRKVRLWDATTGQEIRVFDLPDKVPALCFVPGGKQFLVWQSREGSDDDVTSLIQRIDVATGQAEELITEKGRATRCLAFSTDGNLAAVGSQEGNVRIWQLDSKKKLAEDFPAHSQPVADVALTPDKKVLITCDVSGEIKVWNVGPKPGEPLVTIKAEATGLDALAVSGDGSRFAALGSSGEIMAYETRTGKLLRKWPAGQRVTALAFIADGRQLAAGLGDGTIDLLELP